MMSNNYQRLFYILKNMDSDVGYPTGYIKVEINCEVAKLQISLSNLLNRQGLEYHLYGIKKVDYQLMYTNICDIPYINGRADVKVNAATHSIGSNAIKLEDINIFALIAILPNKTPKITCPLVAYTKGELPWKEDFETLFLNKKTENEKTTLVVESSGNKLDTLAKIVQSEDVKNSEIQAADNAENSEIQVSEGMQKNEIEEPEEIKKNETEASEEIKKHETEASEEIKKNEIEISEGINKNETETSEEAQNSKTKVLEEIQYNGKELDHLDQIEQSFDIKEGIIPENGREWYLDQKLGVSDKFEDAITSIYNKEKSAELVQETLLDLDFDDNDILSSAKENFNDILSIDIDRDKSEKEASRLSLKEELDKSFESYNPFKMKSKNYKWWKINSPGFLNNILFRNSIKSYLLFNPKVMLAHYKYRYIIFGIRNDKPFGKEYLICGVPGVYSIDENPFGNMGSWAQLEGYKPKYGAFGYWIILIDPRTGKLMKIK